MKKVQFGCGENRLAGWENHDADVDITKPLPFADNSVDFCFAEQVLEHVTVHQAWNFLVECRRILKPGGVLRLSVPDIVQFWQDMTPEYCAMEKRSGFSDGSEGDTLKSMIFGHGHQMAWCSELLCTVCNAVGFRPAQAVDIGYSDHPELLGVEGHGKIIGEENNRVVSIAVEATKPKA